MVSSTVRWLAARSDGWQHGQMVSSTVRWLAARSDGAVGRCNGKRTECLQPQQPCMGAVSAVCHQAVLAGVPKWGGSKAWGSKAWGSKAWGSKAWGSKAAGESHANHTH